MISKYTKIPNKKERKTMKKKETIQTVLIYKQRSQQK